MNRSKKQITVRYFSLDSEKNFFDDFISIHRANLDTGKPARITQIRGKKCLVKIHESFQINTSKAFFISVIRERNTWQLKGLGNGQISGITSNQGIIGDPYYLMILPQERLVLGFTTGPSASLKTVAENVLNLFSKDRTSTIFLERVIATREPSALKAVNSFKKIHFKISTSLLLDSSDEVPGLLKDLSSVPFITNDSEIALTITKIGDHGIPVNDMIDLVDYLAEREGCSALNIQGVDNEGGKLNFDFTNAYATYKTVIESRNSFLDEKAGKEALTSAVENFFEKIKTI